MSNIKMNYQNLCEFWGQIPELDHVISLVGTMESQGDGNTGESVGDLGVDITDRAITLVDIGEDNEPMIGELRLFKDNEAGRIRHYLSAYLLTNRDVLEPDTIAELVHLIDIL